MSDRVERYYEAVERADLEAVRAMIAPDAVFHVAGDSPISGDHRGHEEIFQRRLRARPVLVRLTLRRAEAG